MPSDGETAQEDQRRTRSRRRPASGGDREPYITVMDCDLSIKRRHRDIAILVVAGFVFVLISQGVLTVSGWWSDPLVGKVAASALSLPPMVPLKLSWDRYSEASLLRDIRTVLAQGAQLTPFLQSELRKLTIKKRSLI